MSIINIIVVVGMLLYCLNCDIVKVRKQYTLVVLDFRNLAIVTRPNNRQVKFLQKNGTTGCRIYDCTFNELMHNLRIFRDYKVDILIK